MAVSNSFVRRFIGGLGKRFGLTSAERFSGMQTYEYSKRFTDFQRTFKQHASEFFSRTNADEFNAPALDAQIDCEQREMMSYLEMERVMNEERLQERSLDVLHQKNLVPYCLASCDKAIEEVRSELERKLALYESFRRVGNKANGGRGNE